jgi:CarD family transcriptional regulator
MLKNNDFVFYNTTGVCKILDTRVVKFGGQEAQECYVLMPVTDPKSTIYVPTASEELLSDMRPVLSKEEIKNLIQSMPNEEDIWICDERERSKEYLAKIRSCDCHELVRIIKTLCLEKTRKKENGKTLNTTDTKIMTMAEKLLYEEFAFVLGISPKEVIPYIQERIPKDAMQIS